MSIILAPFAKLVLLFYNVTGSYGMSIILFGLVVRLVMFPIFLKGRKSMLSMSSLADKQKELQQKYIRDRERYSRELQKLYDLFLRGDALCDVLLIEGLQHLAQTAYGLAGLGVLVDHAEVEAERQLESLPEG